MRISLWGFDPLVKFSISFAMYIIVDSYMFRVGEVVCIYVSKYLVVEMECIFGSPVKVCGLGIDLH